MNAIVSPGRLRGSILPPVSKSHAQRLLLAAALSENETRLLCPEESDDIAAMAQCLRKLGALILRTKDGYHIKRPVLKKQEAGALLDCGESGAVLRFLLPLCAGIQGNICITGKPTLVRRPIAPLLHTLLQNGACIKRESLPLCISGGLKNGMFTLLGNESSQYFSGLLFALPRLGGDSELHFLPPLASKPYIGLTLQVLERFGITICQTENGWHIPGGQSYQSPGYLEAEKDASAAAFFLAAQKLGSDLTVTGLPKDSLQADCAMAYWLSQIGSQISLQDCPDLGPILSVCAAADRQETCFTHVSRLRLKESDRVVAIARMVQALGGFIRVEDDRMIVRGGALQGGVIDSYGDHRIAMSAAIAATVSARPVTILHAECVRKSYPGFFNDFMRLGGSIRYE